MIGRLLGHTSSQAPHCTHADVKVFSSSSEGRDLIPFASLMGAIFMARRGATSPSRSKFSIRAPGSFPLERSSITLSAVSFDLLGKPYMIFSLVVITGMDSFFASSRTSGLTHCSSTTITSGAAERIILSSFAMEPITLVRGWLRSSVL